LSFRADFGPLQFAAARNCRSLDCARDDNRKLIFAGEGARATQVMFTIDHLGIAVKSLAAAKAIYEKLGLSVSAVETVEGEQVRCVMIPVGETRLELLEPTSDSSVIAKFIAKRGEGLHHVSLRVPDLAAAVERLKKDGVRLVSDEIKVGAGGHRYVFVHPSSTGGVLLELVEGQH
jgi:methylmalonyl-CoA epimerase